MEAINTYIRNTFHLDTTRQALLIETLFLAIILFGTVKIAVWLVERRTNDVNTYHGWRRTIRYFGLIFFTVLLFRIWIREVGSLATYFGLLSAGLAFALSDLLGNIAGWFFIIGRRPFTLGDRIEIDRDTGDVVDIRLFEFTIMEVRRWIKADQSTGRLVHIPNRRVFTASIANYTEAIPYIWDELTVYLTLESDWDLAKQLLEEIMHRHVDAVVEPATAETHRLGEKIAVKLGKMTPIIYTAVGERGIELTMRYLCRPRQRRSIQSAMWEDILHTLTPLPDVQIAYPVQRIYLHPES